MEGCKISTAPDESRMKIRLAVFEFFADKDTDMARGPFYIGIDLTLIH